MTLEDVDRAYVWLCKYASLLKVNKIRFTWFGGEPLLLGHQWLSKALESQQIFANKEILVINTIQTNLSLVSDEIVALFCRYFNGVGCSLDYGSHWRVFPDGTLSTPCVEKRIFELKKSKIPIGAVCTLTQMNAKCLHEMYYYFKSIGVDFKVNRAASSPTMAKQGLLLSVHEYEKVVMSLCDIYLADKSPTIKFDNLTMMMSAYLLGKKYFCTDASKPEYFIGVEANGRVMSRCRFRGVMGDYDVDAPETVYEKFRKMAFVPQAPGGCAKCEFKGKVCDGPCFGEPDVDCLASDCGYRTEVTCGLWSYVKAILEQRGIKYGCMRKREK
jgi:sulfatase maturation enzyme AslB (radical SAM superfamily)